MNLRRAFPVVALVALALGTASPGETLFRCRFDHVARPTCCCDDSRPADELVGMASSDCCCDVETYKLVQPTPQVRTKLTEQPAMAAILPRTVAVLEPATATSSARVDQRNRNGPPIVLLSHSFRV